jgi:predicted phage terminase large subunit-like protein
MVVGHLVNNQVYITDVVFNKGNTDVTIPMVANILNINNPRQTRIEINGMGALFVKLLKNETKCTLVPISNSTNKTTRIFMNSAFVKNNMHFLNTEKGEYFQFLQALAKYSHEGKNINDDAPDSITGLALFFQSLFKF